MGLRPKWEELEELYDLYDERLKGTESSIDVGALKQTSTQKDSDVKFMFHKNKQKQET